MLNLFPDLLTYSFWVPTIIRLTIGLFALLVVYEACFTHRQNYRAICGYSSHKLAKMSPWLTGFTFFILGSFLILGLFTQIIAIIFAFVCIRVGLMSIIFRQSSILSPRFFFLLAIISLSLVLAGGGAWALDLPF
jgi:uncharacterized membrane protein YphA (DoxX/SURF4 family)